MSLTVSSISNVAFIYTIVDLYSHRWHLVYGMLNLNNTHCSIIDQIKQIDTISGEFMMISCSHFPPKKENLTVLSSLCIIYHRNKG